MTANRFLEEFSAAIKVVGNQNVLIFRGTEYEEAEISHVDFSAGRIIISPLGNSKEKSLEKRIETLENENSALEAKIEDLEEEIYTLESEKSDLESEIEELSEKLDGFENDDIAQQMAALKSDNDFLRNSVAELQDRIAKILSPRFQ